MCWVSSVSWPQPNGGPSEHEGRPRRVGPALLARQEAVVRAAPACGDPAMALPSSPRTSLCHREHGRRFQPGPIATSVLISSDVPCSPPMTENSCRGSAASAVIFWNAAQSAAVIAARRRRPGEATCVPSIAPATQTVPVYGVAQRTVPRPLSRPHTMRVATQARTGRQVTRWGHAPRASPCALRAIRVRAPGAPRARRRGWP